MTTTAMQEGAQVLTWPLVERRRSSISPLVRPVHGAGPTPELVLGPALLDAVRQVVKLEFDSRAAPSPAVARSPWMTPPAAAAMTRVPVKAIRAWARDGRIPKRLKNRSPDPKQQKYLVNVNDVVTAAEQGVSPGATVGVPQSLSVSERARQILAQRAAARGR